MHITIEIDDGAERPRVTVSGAPTQLATSTFAEVGAPIDAGPAPDVFATTAAPPPGATDLSVDTSVSAGSAPDLS